MENEGKLNNIAELLNLFPEVSWDRFVVSNEGVDLFGWIDREKDSYKDFALMTIKRERNLGEFMIDTLVTSSARYSRLFALRIAGNLHINCLRVEDYFKNVKCVKLNKGVKR